LSGPRKENRRRDEDLFLAGGKGGSGTFKKGKDAAKRKKFIFNLPGKLLGRGPSRNLNVEGDLRKNLQFRSISEKPYYF